MRRRASAVRQGQAAAPLQYVAGGGTEDDALVDDVLMRIDAVIDTATAPGPGPASTQ